MTCAASALHYSCHLAPWGFQSRDTSIYMHWNGPFAALLFVNDWEYTRNVTFAKHSTYPLLTGLLAWWECYLTARFDPATGTTTLHDDNSLNPDASHEGQKVADPQIALAFIKRLASAIIDIAPAIGATPPTFAARVLRDLTPFNSVPYHPWPRTRTQTWDSTGSSAPSFVVWNHTRCTHDSGFLPKAESVEECESHCREDALCDLFTFCPDKAVPGCEIGPSCWRFSRSQASHCERNATGWTSGLKTAAPVPGNLSVWTAARDYSVLQSDMFSMYPIWPSEYIHRGSDPSALLTAQASSRTYSKFATGRPVELFPAAVRAGTNATLGFVWTAAEILDGMDAWLGNSLGNNRVAKAPGGGIENAGVSRAVQEMLVQAPGGDYLELFPVWPASEPASFANLRTKGGFIVTAS